MHTSIYCHHSSQYWLSLQASSSLNLLDIAPSSWNLLQGKMWSWFLDLFALALGLVWKYPALVVPVFDCALPSQSEDFTIQRQHQEQQLEIRTKQWSTTIWVAYSVNIKVAWRTCPFFHPDWIDAFGIGHVFRDVPWAKHSLRKWLS